MDIMRNKGHSASGWQPRSFALQPLAALMLLFSMPVAADVELMPALSLSTYGYGVKQAGADTDRGMAQSINPGLNLRYQGSWLQTNLGVDHEALYYRDEQRDNSGYSNFRFDNRASFLRDQLQFQLSSARSHRAAGTQFSRYADEVTNGDQMATVDNHSARMLFSNNKLDWLNSKIALSVDESATDNINDPLVLDPSLTAFDLSNRRYSADIALNSARRNSTVFWNLDLNAAKTDRETELDYYNRRGSATLGVTLLSGLALIGRGSYESNSDIGASNRYADFRDYDSVGAGLEWRITERSWWNLTYNKIDDQQGGTEYLGTEFSFQPSRRTRLSGNFDRRFFGRTASVSGSYNLKNLNMQLSFSDSVDSLLGFSGAGSFTCAPGQQFFQGLCLDLTNQLITLPIPNDNLNESLVIRRNGSFSLGYVFSRLTIQLQLGARRDIYLEQDAETKDNFANLSANWQLSQRHSLSMNTSFSDVKYQGNQLGTGTGGGFGQREGQQGSAELALNRRMTPQLTGTLSAKHVKVDFKDTLDDYQENRLSLAFRFQF